MFHDFLALPNLHPSFQDYFFDDGLPNFALKGFKQFKKLFRAPSVSKIQER